MKRKTSELTGATLDWAVAKCVGVAFDIAPDGYYTYKPSTDWSQGGPTIEREKISLTPFPNYWEAQGAGVHYRDDALQTGDTPLVAAMRCFVASKLGDTIDIPEELQ